MDNIEKYLQDMEALIVDIRVELAPTPNPIPETPPAPFDKWLKNIRGQIESKTE